MGEKLTYGELREKYDKLKEDYNKLVDENKILTETLDKLRTKPGHSETLNYAENQEIELERDVCLKGIWAELKDLKNLKKLELGASPTIINSCRNVEDLNQIVNAIANPTEFMEGNNKCE